PILDHQDRTVDSPEESAEVVAQVQGLLGSSWHDGATSRPLVASDFLVVAAYNAQVQRLRHDFNAAGLSGVRIGTVDKFQGQEAPVALLTRAAASAETTPRGLEFLLSPNRLNVAISRGQWAAIVVRSRALTRVLPEETAGISELGEFITLCERARPREVRARTTAVPRASPPGAAPRAPREGSPRSGCTAPPRVGQSRSAPA